MDENVYSLVPEDQKDDPQTITISYSENGTTSVRTGYGYLVTMGSQLGVSEFREARGTEGLKFLIPYGNVIVVDFTEGQVS